MHESPSVYVYHTDDPVCAAVMKELLPDIKIVHSVGENGIKGVTAKGLVVCTSETITTFSSLWKEYGKHIVSRLTVDNIDDIVLRAHVTLMDAIQKELKNLELVASTDVQTKDLLFETSVSFSKFMITHHIAEAMVYVEEWKDMEKIFNETVDKRILDLPKITQWKEHLERIDVNKVVMYVICPSITEGCFIHAVKQPFPEDWRMLSGTNLCTRVGIPSEQPVHELCIHDGTVCKVASNGAAYELIHKALELNQ